MVLKPPKTIHFCPKYWFLILKSKSKIECNLVLRKTILTRRAVRVLKEQVHRSSCPPSQIVIFYNMQLILPIFRVQTISVKVSIQLAIKRSWNLWNHIRVGDISSWAPRLWGFSFCPFEPPSSRKSSTYDTSF